jgi:hypothetical protein
LLKERRVIIVEAEHEAHASDTELRGCLNCDRSVGALNGADDLGATRRANGGRENTIAEAPRRVRGMAR